ncbi:hypothetical protein [Sporosarcina globispora]|uniref:hypothetical protein n=1 Tax=Sporosarcina globispora TaxID=1459 RepID=UPI0006A9CD97|nr:hypothetical protein [Sporosarcina globispora]
MISKLIEMDRHMRITLLLSGFALSIISMPFVGSIWFVSFILAFCFLGVLIYTNGQYDKQYSSIMEKSLDKSLIKLDFQADDSYLSDDYLSGIAISEEQNKIAILKRNNVNEDFKLESFNLDQIIEVGIKEDGETTTKTSKGLAVGGTLLAGVGGAIAGGVLGSKTSTEQILKATLSIVVDDLGNPVHEIHFLNSKMLVSKNSDLYQNIFSEMNKWNKRISIVIKRNELNTQSI